MCPIQEYWIKKKKTCLSHELWTDFMTKNCGCLKINFSTTSCLTILDLLKGIFQGLFEEGKDIFVNKAS